MPIVKKVSASHADFFALIDTIQTKKVLIYQHMEKLYDVVINPTENSVNRLDALIRLKKLQKANCRRSPEVFARLGGDDNL